MKHMVDVICMTDMLGMIDMVECRSFEFDSYGGYDKSSRYMGIKKGRQADRQIDRLLDG